MVFEGHVNWWSFQDCGEGAAGSCPWCTRLGRGLVWRLNCGVVKSMAPFWTLVPARAALEKIRKRGPLILTIAQMTPDQPNLLSHFCSIPSHHVTLIGHVAGPRAGPADLGKSLAFRPRCSVSQADLLPTCKLSPKSGHPKQIDALM